MSNKYSREEQHALKSGLYVIFALIVLSLLFIYGKTTEEHRQIGSYYPVYAWFNRIDGLQVGDSVRLAGIDIGKVVATELNNKYGAVITLKIKNDVQLTDDSSASIVSYGIMGTKYIEIMPGSSEDYILPEGRIGFTEGATVLEELVNRVVDMNKAKKQADTKDKGETK